jgi:hypothetical protein
VREGIEDVARDLGHGGAAPRLRRELREHDEDVRLAPIEEDHAGVVVDRGDVPGLVRDARGLRQAGGDAAAVLLLEHDLEHLLARRGGVRAAVGDDAEELEQPVRGDLVVDAGLERGLVLDAAQDFDAVDLELVEGLLDIVDADDLDEEVGGEVARLGDHPEGELADGEGLAEVAVDVGVGVAGQVEHERLLVDDRGEAVADVHRRVEGEVAALDLAHHAEEDGQLHRGGGVEVLVAVVRPLDGGLAVVEGDAELLELVLLLQLQDVAVEGDFRRRDRVLRRSDWNLLLRVSCFRHHR